VKIIYRVLRTPQGERLRAIATTGDLSHRTARAIDWLRANYAKPLHMQQLAAISHMGVSTLQHPFRALTAISPLQYQKQLTLQNLTKMIDLQSTAVSSNLTVQQALQLKRNAFNAQVMLSNLGRLPFDSTFRRLKLETFWAPSALRGIEGEQTIGAVTVNNSLHLTHTSPAPIPRLLAGMEEVLRNACAV
jgi:hypothetical protein